MSALDSTLLSLSEVATIIWQAADGRTPLTEIVQRRVCPEFDITPEAAYRDAQAFVTGGANGVGIGLVRALLAA